MTFIALIFAISCSKLQPTKSVPQTLPNTFTFTSNPFDYLGELHNDALYSVGLHSSFPELTPEQRFTVINNTNVSELGSEFSLSFSDIGYGNAYVSYSSDYNMPQTLYSNGTISEEIRNYLYDIYEALGVTSDPTSSSATVSDAFEAMAIVEESIYNRYGEPSTDLILDLEDEAGISAYLLMTCAIAKHSYSFWYDAHTISTHPWYSILPTENQTEMRPSWLGNTLRDIGGFFRTVRWENGLHANYNEMVATAQSDSANPPS